MAVNIAEQRQTPDTSDGGTHHVWGSLTQNIKLNLIQPLISLLMYGKCWGQSNDWWHLGAATSKTQPTCKAPGFFNAKMAEGKKIKGACTDERNGKYISNNHTVWACLGSRVKTNRGKKIRAFMRQPEIWALSLILKNYFNTLLYIK